MAEEAFALSPISARGSLPSETDYVAIREAFLETARGRWFLSEFSKRNRTADTNEVLDAVARIEATIAATRDSAATLIGAMSGIRAAVRAAKVSAAEAMPRPGADDQFVDARQSIQTISKVTMTMRECGADPRICNLLDSELKVIAASQQVESITESRKSVLAAFDVLIQRIEGLALRDDSVAGGRTDVHVAPTTPAAPPVQAIAPVAEKPVSSVTPLFPAAEIAQDIAPEMIVADTLAVDAWDDAALEADAVAADITSAEYLASEAIELETALADAMAADDLAMLDLVAAEMGVPESAIETLAASPTQAVVATAISAPSAIAPAALPAAALAAVAASVSMQAQFARAASVFKAEMRPKPEAASLPRQQIPAQPSHALPDDIFGELPSDSRDISGGESLGAALLANGVIAHPSQPQADPLAAIRRMSQNEKIAFFS